MRAASRPPGAGIRAPVARIDPAAWLGPVGGPLMVSMEPVDDRRPELDAAPGSVAPGGLFGFRDRRRPGPVGAGRVGRRPCHRRVLVINPDPSDDHDRRRSRPRRHPGTPGPAQRFVRAVLSSHDFGPSGHRRDSTWRRPANGTQRQRQWRAATKHASPRAIPAHSSACASWPPRPGAHWRPLVAVALVGMLLGAGLHLVVPRKYAATTSLYLTEPAASDPAQAMANDVSLLQTRAVAEQRRRRAPPPHHAPRASLRSYQGVASSNAILVDHRGAALPADAVSRADAVAKAFLAVRYASCCACRPRWW